MYFNKEKRNPSLQLLDIPGPTTYIVFDTTKKNQPSYKFSKAQAVSPKPNQSKFYETQEYMGQGTPKYTFGLKLPNEANKQKFPIDPGTYEPQYSQTLTSSPQFTIRSRLTFQFYRNQSPGPQKYYPKSLIFPDVVTYKSKSKSNNKKHSIKSKQKLLNIKLTHQDKQQQMHNKIQKSIQFLQRSAQPGFGLKNQL